MKSKAALRCDFRYDYFIGKRLQEKTDG